METNLDSIIQQGAEVSRANQILVQEEQVKLAGAEQQTEAYAGNLVRSATLSAQATQVEALGNMEAKNIAIANATALGSNALDVNSLLIPLSQSIRANTIAHSAARAKVQDIERNSDLLTNPGGWLKDLLVGDEARADRDAIAENLAADTAHLKSLHDLTQEDVQTQLALAQTSTAESIQANADAGVTLAKAQAAEAKAKAMQFSVEGIRGLRTNNNQEWNRNLQVYNARARDANAAKDRELREEQLKLARGNASRAETKAKGDEYINTNINMGRAARNLPPIPIALTAAEYNSNTPNGAQYRYFSSLGQASIDRNSAVIGFTPAGALHSFELYGGDAAQVLGDTQAGQILLATQGKVMQAVSEIKSGVKRSKNAPNYGLTPQILQGKNAQDAIDNAINSAFNDDLASFDEGFAERSHDITGFLQEFPEYKETELFKGVIKPGMASGIHSITPSEIAVKAAELFSLGEIPSTQVADELVGLVTAMQAYNAAAGGRTAFGMALPVYTQLKVELPYKDTVAPSVSNFLNAPPSGAAALGLTLAASYTSPLQAFREIVKGTERVDLSSETSFSSYLARFRSAKVAGDLQDAANKDTP